MKIIILSNNAGGLYQFRQELLETLVLQHEVVCSIPDTNVYTKKIEKIGCKCLIINMNRRGINPREDISLLRKYYLLLREHKPDMVLTYTIKPNIYGGIACQMLKIPYLANITGLGTAIENKGPLQKLALTMYRVGLRKARCVFFQNKQNQELFIRKKIVKGRTKLIPGSGVNLNAYPFEPYPFDKDVFRFLFVGRIMKDKGIEELLSAIDELFIDGRSVFLDIVGGFDENYDEIVKKYEQRGMVKYHGRQENVHKFYKRAHCVVLPSYHEGMANVLLEAASTGRPVVSTRVSGCKETFQEGVTGFGCEAKDISSLKAAMAKMCDLSREERANMGICGRKLMEESFDRNIVVKTYLDEMQA